MPTNPNESSLLSLVTDDKTNHLRMLVEKQKSDTKKKKTKLSSNRKFGNYTANNNNNSFSFNNFQNSKNNYHHRSNTSLHSNQSYQTSSFNRANNKNQNNGYKNYRSNTSSVNYNQTNQLYSFDNPRHNDTCSSGYVTVELKQFLEKVISENKMVNFFFTFKIVRLFYKFNCYPLNPLKLVWYGDIICILNILFVVFSFKH